MRWLWCCGSPVSRRTISAGAAASIPSVTGNSRLLFPRRAKNDSPSRLYAGPGGLPRKYLPGAPVKFDIESSVFLHRFAHVVVDRIGDSLMVRVNVQKHIALEATIKYRVEEVHAAVELLRQSDHRKILDGEAAQILRLMIAEGLPA